MKLNEAVTLFEHTPADGKFFIVTAAEPWSIGMIQRLKHQRPDEVKIGRVNADGSLVAELPLSWMRIVPKKEVTESQREAARNNFKKPPDAPSEIEPNSG